MTIPFDPSKLQPLGQDTTSFDPSRLPSLDDEFTPPPSLDEGDVGIDGEIDWSQAGTPIGVDQDVNFLEVASNITNDRKARMQIYRGLLQRPDVSPDQKARIQRFYKQDSEDDSWWLNAKHEDRNAANNFLRGVADGIVRFGTLGLADFGVATAQLPFHALKKIEILDKIPFQAARQAIRNRQEGVKFYFDPQGVAGFAGQVGGVVASGKPWSSVNKMGLSVTSKLPGIGPKITAFMKTAFAPTAPVKQRLIGELIGGGTVDVMQAMDVVLNDELFPTWDDKYRAIALTSAGSLAGAVVGTTTRGGKKPSPHDSRNVKPLNAADEANAKRTVEETLTAIKTKAASDAAAIQARRSAKQGAAVVWNGMPENTRKTYIEGLASDDYIKSWKELGPEAKNKIVEIYKALKQASEARAAAAEAKKTGTPPAGTNLDKETEAPAPPPAVTKTLPPEPAAQAEAAELPTKPVKAVKKPKAAAPSADPLDIQLAELKARVAKEGVPPPPLDLKTQDLGELHRWAVRGNAVIDEQVVPVKIDDVMDEFRRRKEELTERIQATKDKSTDEIVHGTLNDEIELNRVKTFLDDLVLWKDREAKRATEKAERDVKSAKQDAEFKEKLAADRAKLKRDLEAKVEEAKAKRVLDDIKAEEAKAEEKFISPDDAIGAKITQVVRDPNNLDANGDPVLMAAVGDIVTPELVARIGEAGIDKVPTDRGNLAVPYKIQNKPPTIDLGTMLVQKTYEGHPESNDVYQRPTRPEDFEEGIVSTNPNAAKVTPAEPKISPAESFMKAVYGDDIPNADQAPDVSRGGSDVKVGNATIRIRWDPRRKNEVYFVWLEAKNLKKGEGSKALKHVTDLADKHGVILRLTASAQTMGDVNALSQSDLVKWYARHGFEIDPARTAEAGDPNIPEMVRRPQPTPEAAALTEAKPVTSAEPTPKPAKAPKAKRTTTPPPTPAVEVKNYLAAVNEPGHITGTDVVAELGTRMQADPQLAGEVQALAKRLSDEGLDANGVLEGVEKFARILLNEEQKAPTSKVVAKPEKSLFYGIQIKKPLDQLTLDELDKLITRIDKRFERKSMTSEEYGQALLAIGKAKDVIKGVVKKVEPKSVESFEPTKPEDVGKVKTKDIVVTKRLPDSYKQNVSGMTDEALLAHATEVKTEIEARTQGIKNPEKQVPELIARAERVARELKRRGYELQKEGGFLRIGKPSSERGFINFPKKRVVPPETPEEQLISSVVKTDAKLGEPFNMRTYITRFLTRVYRKNLALPDPTGPRHQSPREVAEQGNAYQGMAEEFLTGDGPFLPTDDGNYVRTGAPSLQAILNTPGVPPGDARYLGNLWYALHSIEQAGVRKNVVNSNPELLAAAEAMVRNSNPASLRAVRLLVGYMRSLADFGVWSGLLSPDQRAKFNAMFYAPTKVIFASGANEGQPRTVSLSRKQPDVVSHGQPFKRATGSQHEVVNPIENAIEITHRILRSAWMNKLTTRLTDWARQNPEQARGLIEPASPQLRNQIKAEIRAGAQQLQEATGNAYTMQEADRLVSMMGDRQLSLRNDLMVSWREGRMEVWRLSPDISFSLKSHSPGELALIWRLMGIPGRALHFGIVGNPTFVLTQSLLLDPFTAWVRSKYGFVPGVDTVRGLYHAIMNTETYREYRRAGGGRIGQVSSVAKGGRTGLADVVEPIRYVRNAEGKLVPEHTSNIRLAGRQLKEGRIGDFWLTTIAPFEVANRLGEYMRARESGASQFEAIAAANNVLPNYHRMGASMRAAAYITPFMNIGIQSIGSTVETIKSHPMRWLAKSATMGLGAAYLWAVNKDDQEIKDLRKTPSGARYFFFRSPWNPDEIMKVRKPYIEAAVFATGVESILDSLEEQDPEAAHRLVGALLQEASIGFVGPWASVPLQLYYGQELPAQYPIDIIEPQSTPLIPEWQKDIEPMFQYTNASLAARAVGNQLNVSPANVDALVRGLFGTVGQDIMKGISAAMVYSAENQIPVPEELPIISTFYAKYPSNNLHPVRKYYDEAERVEIVANTINYMALHAPEKIEDYINDHEEEVALIGTFKDTRKAITDLRKGLGTIKSAPGLSYSERKNYEREMLRMIIEIARQTNEAVAMTKREIIE